MYWKWNEGSTEAAREDVNMQGSWVKENYEWVVCKGKKINKTINSIWPVRNDGDVGRYSGWFLQTGSHMALPDTCNWSHPPEPWGRRCWNCGKGNWEWLLTARLVKGRPWLGGSSYLQWQRVIYHQEKALWLITSVAAGLAVSVPCPRAGEWKILFKGKTHNVNWPP